jgi:phosphoglycerol geranylgeranyltransferase
MTRPWEQWSHVTKVDPDKDLAAGDTYDDVMRTGTDAIEIGGTTGMTVENMTAVVESCAEFGVPLYQEPSNPSVVIDADALDGYLIPTVFNAGDPFWVTGAHKEWIRIESGLDWSQTVTEAYIVLNPESSVAQVTEADCDQTPDDVASYAAVAERMFGQEIVYVEYSGTFGSPDHVAAANEATDDATLFYGGGIHDYGTAYTMGEHADTIVVGNLLHDEGAEAVAETVRGVRDAQSEA